MTFSHAKSTVEMEPISVVEVCFMSEVLLDPRALHNMRTFFKYLNRFMVLQWHLGLGQMLNFWPKTLGCYMVIVHKGRKSGKHRYTPVNFAVVDGEIYCTAGFGSGSDWYQNIMATPEVDVWLPDGWYGAVAEDISNSPDRFRLLSQVITASGFVAPLLGVDMAHLNEQEMQRIAADYRLVHIHRTAPKTGSGGPGKWSWVWPLSTILLALIALRPQSQVKAG
jgi:deazaflavin-dependent oxidoreductase (nitroreductase family)